jgi:hypothetical protein
MEGLQMNWNAKIIVLTVGCLLSLGACVSTRTTGVSDDSASAMHGKSIAISQRTKPDFSAMTAGKAMFGVLGATAMISAGNKIVVDNNIEDPASFVADQLRHALENKYGLVTAAGTAPLADSMDTRKLASLYSAGDFVLDVQTVNWSFQYRPNLTHYRVMYSVKVRLIDTHGAKLLAEAFCYRKDDDDKNPPTHEELLADQAALLKTRLHDHAAQCAGELTNKLLGTPLS